MTGGLEAAGDAMTGAVIARAVEPPHGEALEGRHDACLNCGTALMGSHCHNCGQAAHVHRSLSSLGHDILHGVFHFEGKAWRTLPMLVWRPGELTRRYIHGERARFVSPLALFLFTVFLMFATVTSLAGEFHVPEVSAANKVKSLKQINAEIAQKKAQRTALTAQMSSARNAGRAVRADVLDKQRDDLDQQLDSLALARDFFGGKSPTFIDDNGKSGLGVNTGVPRIDAAIKKANENPNLLLYKLQSSAYKYAWALILLSTPFVWLMFFWKRQYKLYDHAIFVTYSLTFMMLLVIGLTAIGVAGAPGPVISILGSFVPPLHLYRQLRGAYQIGRVGAIIRTFILAIMGAIVLTLFLLMLLGLGIMG